MRLCEFPGCGRKHDTGGLCGSHRVQRAKGRPLTAIAPNLFGRPPGQRFWAKVNKDGPVVRAELGPRWVWTAATTEAGYGWFTADRKAGPVLAHRFAWTEANGDPGEMLVCHECDNKPCVRPGHMFLGTDADNILDAAIKLRLKHKLEPLDVKLIRATYELGVGPTELAARWGVSVSTIEGITARRIWKHVPDLLPDESYG